MCQWGKVGKSRAHALKTPLKGGTARVFGRYDYTIDAKGRLNFPAKFRDAMGESFVVRNGWTAACSHCPWRKSSGWRTSWKAMN